MGRHRGQSEFKINRGRANGSFGGAADLLGFGPLVTAASAVKELAPGKKGKQKAEYVERDTVDVM